MPPPILNIKNLTPTKRSSYDISHPALDPFPSYLAPSFFNQRHIQSALGVPLNFSWYGLAPEETYAQVVGDATRGNISNLEYVLQSGYRVAMVHGDRDYRCNCKCLHFTHQFPLPSIMSQPKWCIGEVNYIN